MANEIIPQIEDKLGRYGDQIVTQIRQELVKQGKLATGDLYNSIQYGISKNGDSMSLTIYANDYFKWVDQGVKPGGKQPPPDKMLKWVEDRGLRPKPGSGIPESQAKTPQANRSLAFLIGRSISQKGIKPGNILEPILSTNTQTIGEGIRDILVSTITQMIGEGFQAIASEISGEIFKIDVTYPKS
jgi:hypothetical protein